MPTAALTRELIRRSGASAGQIGHRKLATSSRCDVAAFQALLAPFPPATIDREQLTAFLAAAAVHLDRLLTSSLRQRAMDAPHFNIFQIIGRERFEVTTHSSLLAYLLNPLADHEQGDLFLSQFLLMINDQRREEGRPPWLLPVIDSTWRIRTEIDYIDICLHHPGSDTYLIIENKWNAPDQDQQVFRYWSRIRGRLKQPDRPIPVILSNKVQKVSETRDRGERGLQGIHR